MRHGAKTTTPHLVVYRARQAGMEPQVGIVVSGKYGNAVKRNLVRRRIRSVMSEKIRTQSLAMDVVFRLRFDANEATWPEIVTEIQSLDLGEPALGFRGQ